MHDLDLVREDSTFAACEITAAADPESIELWNLVNGGGRWIEPNLAGGWMLTLAPACRAKNLRALAPGLLRRIEANPTDSLARAELEGLGVLNTYHGGTAFPGSIYATIERPSEFTGGWVSDDGDPIVAWLDAWISDAHQAHNLQKLAAAKRAENHLFVLLPGFSSAPFTAADLLLRSDAPLPTVAPVLPEPVTHVWLMSTWDSGAIFHWTGERWVTFPKVFDVSD